MTQAKKKIIIAGAGAIGNYIGVQLRKSRQEVVFLGSSRVVNAVHQHGLSLEYPHLPTEVLTSQNLSFTEDPACCRHADLVIITVKSTITSALAEQIKPYLASQTTVLTLQNGVSHADVLKKVLPDHRVVAGMVTFNVIEINAHTFRLTTSGEIYLQQTSPSLLEFFTESGLPAKEAADIRSLLWSKLLLNLINPLNALSGQSLKQNLEDHHFRLHWANCMREGLAVLKAAGIKPAKITPLPLPLLPLIISLPNWIYLALAKNMTDMDPSAKSSMAQDMEKGQTTEIDYLTAELLRLGKQLGVRAPVNTAIYAKIIQMKNDAGRP